MKPRWYFLGSVAAGLVGLVSLVLSNFRTGFRFPFLAANPLDRHADVSPWLKICGLGLLLLSLFFFLRGCVRIFQTDSRLTHP